MISLIFTGTTNAQCATSLLSGTGIVTGNNILFDAVPQPTTTPVNSGHTTIWWAYSGSDLFNGTTTETSTGFGHSYTFTNVPAGAYTVCAHYIPTQTICPSYTNCTVVTVTASPSPCPTSFSYTTDVNCVSDLTNLSTGNITSSVWTIDGPIPATSYTSTNLSVPYNNFAAHLTNYTNGIMCGQTSQTININCASTTSCQAIFSVASTSVCNEVSFTNFSYGNVAYYHWDFGDGTTSNMANNSAVIHQYPNVVANYQATLSVYSSTASSIPCSSTIRSVNVSCVQPVCPTGLFPSNATTNGTDIQFYAVPQPTTVPSGAPHTTYWSVSGPNGNFTGTTNQNSPNFGHDFTFTNIPPGTYTVFAIYYSGQSGCSTPYSHSSVITVSAGTPTCATSFNYSTDSNCVTNLVNTSTGNITSSVWSISSWSNTVTTYTSTNLSLNSSVFSAVLTNYTNGNLCGQATQTITVICPSTTTCNAIFSVASTSICNEKQFTNSSSPNAAYYHWDFGDGTISNVTNTSTFTHQYPNTNASYMALLSVYSSTAAPTGCSSYTVVVNVQCTAASTCQSAFSVSQGTVCADKQFTNLSSGTIAYCTWDFGDNTSLTSSGNSGVGHSYPNINTSYLATLSVYDSTVNPTPCSVITQTVHVYCSTCSITSSITIFADTANAGNYFCYNLSTGNGALSYFWDFGDGTSSTQQFPFHQYAIPGNYPVCLTTTNTNGTVTCSDTDCDSSSVQRMATGFLMSSLNVVSQTVTGIKNLNANVSLNVYPNPMSDLLNIEIGDATENRYSITLVDAIGREVIRKDVQMNNALLNVSGLQKGYYCLMLLNANGVVIKTTKLVK
ncbi:MAG: PKD domain-containing protein [Bacteroidota bacterium]